MDYQAMLAAFQQRKSEKWFTSGTNTGFYQDDAWLGPFWEDTYFDDDDTRYHSLVFPQPYSSFYIASNGSVAVSSLEDHPEFGTVVDADAGEFYCGERSDGVPHGMGTVFFCGKDPGKFDHKYAMYIDGIWQNGVLQYIRIEDKLVSTQDPYADSDSVLAAAKLCTDAARFTETPERAAVYLALAGELTAHISGIAGDMERCWTTFSDPSASEEMRLTAAEQYVQGTDGAAPDKERLAEMLEFLDAHDEARWHKLYIHALLDTYTMHYNSYDATDHPDYSGYSKWYRWGFSRNSRLYGFIFKQNVYNDNPYDDDAYTDSAGLTEDGIRIVHGVTDSGEFIGSLLPPELLVERDEKDRVIYCGQHKNGVRHGLGVTIKYGPQVYWTRGFWQNGAQIHIFGKRRLD